MRLFAPGGSPDRVDAELSDGRSLRLNTQLVAEWGLYAGMELEEDALEKLERAVNLRRTKERGLRMTGARAMSHREVTDRLTRRGSSREDAEETADWLEKLGAVDDAEYARMLVRHYAAAGYGPGKIRSELIRRGIARDLWDEAMTEYGDEDARAAAVAERKLPPAPDREQLRKCAALLQRRGFGYDAVRAALSRFGDEGEQD